MIKQETPAGTMQEFVTGPDEFNRAVELHERTNSEWDLRPLADKFHRWHADLNAEFFSPPLPKPYLCFKPRRMTILGHYAPFLNEVGARDEISFNPRTITEQCEIEQAAVLLHEMIHQYEHLNKIPVGSGGYHRKSFREKAAKLGIPCSAKGYRIGLVGNPFVAWAKQAGLSDDAPILPLFYPPARRVLRKWKCHCTNIWAATEVSAVCVECRQPFKCMSLL